MEIKIKDKYGITLKTKGKYCDDNIEILVDESLTTPKLQDKKVTENGEVVADEGFDGLGKVTVEIAENPGAVIKMNGTATPVPNEGYVDTIYFNTNMNDTDVVEILSQLTYIQTPFAKNPVYPILFAADGNPVVFALTYDGIYEINVAVDIVNQVYERVFYFSESEGEKGFKIDKYIIAKDVLSEYTGLVVGTENDKLVDLISTTPFSGDDLLLEGEYDGSMAEICDISGWDGTPIPNNGEIGTVYFNTNMSVEEVEDIIFNANLPLDDDRVYSMFFKAKPDEESFNSELAVMIVTKELAESMGIYTDRGVIVIAASNTVEDDRFIFLNVDPETLGETTSDEFKKGWMVDKFEFNITADGISAGNENFKLSSIISTTKFTKSLDKTFNVLPFIKNGKIPTRFKLNVPTGGGETSRIKSNWTESAIPNSGTVKNIYLNTSLYAAEVISIIENANIDFNLDMTGDNFGHWYVVASSEECMFLIVNIDNKYCIAVYYTSPTASVKYIFASDDLSEYGVEFIGWNPNFKNDITFTSDLIPSLDNVEFGLSNNDLVRLISTVNPGKDIKLKGDYAGNQYEKTQMDCIVGETIPNSGFVENVYLNTTLSVNEVTQILYESNPINYYVAMGIVGTSNGAKNLTVQKFGDCYVIQSLKYENSSTIADEIYFIYVPDEYRVEYEETIGEIPFYGWNPEFNGVISINANVSDRIHISENNSGSGSGLSIGSVGEYNSNLTKLFSLTPFTAKNSEKLNIDLVPLIENQKKIPTSISVNVKKSASIGGEWSGPDPVVPKYIDYGTSEPASHFNTMLTTDDADFILSKLTYTDLLGTGFNDTYGIIAYASTHETPKPTDGNTLVYAKKLDDGYIIAQTWGDGTIHYYYNSCESLSAEAGGIGWRDSWFNWFSKVRTTTYLGTEIGLENASKLHGLLSESGKFEQEKIDLVGKYAGTEIELNIDPENNVIDLREFLNNQKLPLKIKINLHTYDGGYEELED